MFADSYIGKIASVNLQLINYHIESRPQKGIVVTLINVTDFCVNTVNLQALRCKLKSSSY